MEKEKTKIKQLVIKTYAQAASQSCCLSANTCCSPETNPVSLLEAGKMLGYSERRAQPTVAVRQEPLRLAPTRWAFSR